MAKIDRTGVLFGAAGLAVAVAVAAFLIASSNSASQSNGGQATATTHVQSAGCWAATGVITFASGRTSTKDVSGCGSHTYTQKIGLNDEFLFAASPRGTTAVTVMIDCGHGPTSDTSSPGVDASAHCSPAKAPGAP